LDKLDGVRSETSQEERSFFFFLAELSVVLDFSVWHNNVVNIFLIMLRCQPQSASEFSHFSLGATRCCLQNNVVAFNLPKTVALRLNSYDEEVDRDDWALADIEVFLHETDNALSAFCNGQAELGVVEPTVASVQVDWRLLLFL